MTTSSWRGIIVGTIATIAFAGAWIGAQQTRDVAGTPVVGTATVSGTVVTDGAQPNPVRRAVVTIAGDAIGGSREVVTNDRGEFSFSALVAGHYALSVSKGAWLTTYYGSQHPGRRPYGASPLVVRNAEHVGPLTLPLVHGGSITGRILDATGRPASAFVSLIGARTVNGQRVPATQTSPRNGQSDTDDRGVYRFYGLAPGDYIVVAQAESFEGQPTPLYQMTPEQWQAAQHPSPATNAGAASAQENPQGPAVAMAPVYYPGAVDFADATPVTIAPGEEKDGIDFVLKLVSTSRVSGSIVSPDGQPPFGPVVTLQSKTDVSLRIALPFMGQSEVPVRVGRDGAFVAASVPPGEYTIIARAQDRSAAPAPNGRAMPLGAVRGGGPALWATQDVSVAGQDVSGLTLALQPGMTISGRVVADASVTTSLDQWNVRAVPAGDQRMGVPIASPDATGNFSLAGAAPGNYRLMVVQLGPGRAGRAGRGAAAPAPVAAAPSTPAVVASASVHGQDGLDLPFEVRPGENVQDVVVRLTNHLGEISGALRTGAGQPATGYVIVVFAADRAYWATDNRRMPQPAATDRDGAYRVGGLPAGEYLVAAATDLDPDSVHDVEMLAALASQAIHVTLAEGEAKTQNLTIGGG